MNNSPDAKKGISFWNIFSEAVEHANKLDVDEPPLVVPDWPEHLKDEPKRCQKDDFLEED